MKTIATGLALFCLLLSAACADEEPTGSSNGGAGESTESPGNASTGTGGGDEEGSEGTTASSSGSSDGKPSKPPKQCKKSEEACTVDFDCCSGSCIGTTERCR